MQTRWRVRGFAAGKRLVGAIRIDKSYSSDLSRARDTLTGALKGANQSDVPLIVREEIRERDYGDMIGWRRSSVQETFGEAVYLGWRRGYSGNAERPAGGENLKDVQERSLPTFLGEIMQDIAEGKNVIVSAHGNSLRSMLISLREHTNGRALTEDEIRKLEVALSTPIVIAFDGKLNHEELWVDANKGPADIIAFLRSKGASSSINTKPGGIDFRANAMQINYQPMGNFSELKLKLPALSKAELDAFNIDSELAQINSMIEGEILPSGARILELLAACSQKGELEAHRDSLKVLLVKTGILQETTCCVDDASQEFKEALVLAEAL